MIDDHNVSKINSRSSRRNPEKEPRFRSKFTKKEVDILEDYFSVTECITNSERTRLASMLDKNDRQITVWFQNRRQKKRKDNLKNINSDIDLNLSSDTSSDTRYSINYDFVSSEPPFVKISLNSIDDLIADKSTEENIVPNERSLLELPIGEDHKMNEDNPAVRSILSQPPSIPWLLRPPIPADVHMKALTVAYFHAQLECKRKYGPSFELPFVPIPPVPFYIPASLWFFQNMMANRPF